MIDINIDRENVARSDRVWSKDQQLFIAVEELSELIQSISKARRGRPVDNVIEELADCYIVMEIVKDQFNISDEEIDNIVQYKQQRLERKMDNLFLEEEGSKEQLLCDDRAPWVIDVDTICGSKQTLNVKDIKELHADVHTNSSGEISVVLHTTVDTHEGDAFIDINGSSIYRTLAKLSRFTDTDITQAVEDLFFDGPKSIRSDYNFMTLYKEMSLDTREHLFPDGMK